ncbi:MAG: glutaredoxin [Zetaproteobacteria bacterium]|nr:glutaredoxin [Zetaproteobacteria bacterium]
MQKVEIYTSRYCGFCMRAKSFLSQQNIPHTEIDITSNPNLREQASKQYNWHTVPIIVIGGTLLGGHDDLLEAHASGQLDKLINEDS